MSNNKWRGGSREGKGCAQVVLSGGSAPERTRGVWSCMVNLLIVREFIFTFQVFFDLKRGTLATHIPVPIPSRLQDSMCGGAAWESGNKGFVFHYSKTFAPARLQAVRRANFFPQAGANLLWVELRIGGDWRR